MPVFSLSEVRTNQIKNYENTFEEQVVSSYGYFVGGSPNLSTVGRLDLSTDTAIDIGSKNPYGGTFGCNTPGSGDSGFIIAGAAPAVPGTVCNIVRISYSNETLQESTSKLEYSRYLFSVGQNPQYGYVIAGYKDPSGQTCLVDRLEFNSETIAASTPYPAGRLYHYGVNSPSHHYFTGGEFGPRTSTSDVERFAFSTEVFDVLTANTVISQSGGAFSGNGGGYYYGGYVGGNIISTVTRFEFSTDNATTKTNMSVAEYGTASAQSPSFGYSIGGITNPYVTSTSNILRYDFDSDVWNNTQTLSANRHALFGQTLVGGTKITRGTPKYTNWKEYASYGYFGGGYGYTGGSYGTKTNFDRLDLTTETTALLPMTASNGRRSTTAVTDGSKAFISGEDSGADILYSESETINFNGVRGVVGNTERNANNFMNYDGTYGYINGGHPTVLVPTTKYDFGTDTAVSTAPYYRIIDDTSTAANLRTYGYVVGGFSSPPAALSKNDVIGRYEYDTETSSELTSKASFRSSASAQITNVSSELGYRLGGQGVSNANVTSLERLDYSVDGTSSIIGNLTVTHQRGLVAQNGSYGWVRGGANPPAVGTSAIMLCTIQRIDFASETLSNPGQPSPVDRGSCQHGGISAGTALRQVGRNNRNDSRAGLDNQGRQVSSSYGYSIGSSPNRYEVDRFDFLNETYNQINGPSNPAPFGQTSQGGTISTKSFGYYTAHQVPSGPIDRSIVARLDFTNDSWIDTPTIMTYLTHRIGTVYNHNYGYIAGGENPSANDYSYIDRFDFGTESINLLTATLSQGRERLNTGRLRDNALNYGYFMGGYAASCTVDRLDMTTESASASTGMPIANNFCRGYSDDNANLGYYGGGVVPSGYQSDIIRFDFSTETHSDTGTNTSYYGLNATQNDNYAYGHTGYILPGGPYTSNTERIEFSSLTVSEPAAKTSTTGSNGVGMSN